MPHDVMSAQAGIHLVLMRRPNHGFPLAREWRHHPVQRNAAV